MGPVLSIAIKDIRLLLRDKMAAFFVLVFPLLMGLFFGLMMNPGGSSKKAKMKVAIVDQDESVYSRLLVDKLQGNSNLSVEPEQLQPARDSVRTGSRVAMLVIPSGFGSKAGMFWEPQSAIQLGVDPSRSAEGAMLEGFVMEAVGGLVAHRFNHPLEMLGTFDGLKQQVREDSSISDDRRSLLLDMFEDFDGLVESLDRVQEADDEASDSAGEQAMGGFRLAEIEKIDVTREIDPASVEGQVKKMRSRWDISFPQAMLWGIMGCVAGFAISIAQEREAGTLLRLQVSPISRMQLLTGKALACFLSALGVMMLITVVGYFMGMRPQSLPKLGVAAVAVALAFVGVMMSLATLGKSVQSTGGIGWAANMVMAMFGGAMVPIMFMPEAISKISIASPVRWAIQSIEGAIWRDFTWAQMAFNCGVLMVIGIVGLAIGVWNSRRLTD